MLMADDSPSHGQPRTPSAQPPDLPKPAGRTSAPKRIQAGRRRAGAKQTNHSPAAAITPDTGVKECHLGTSHHDDHGTRGAAATVAAQARPATEELQNPRRT